MSIFGTRRQPVAEPEVAVEAYQGYVGEGLEGIQSIVAESSQEAFQLRAGMYISDVIMEESVLEGTATPEVLMEGFVKDSFTRIGEIIQKLWSKVTAWFDAAKKQIQIFFTSGKKFVEKFKTEIEGKASAGFTYTGFKYTFGNGDSEYDKLEGILKKTITNAVGNVSANTMSEQHDDIAGSGDKYKESFNLSEEKEKVVKALGGDDMSGVLKNLHKAYRGGKDSKEEIKDFAANSKEELIGFVTDKKDSIKALQQYQKDINEDFARVLKAIKAAKAKIEGSKEGEAADRGRQVTFAQHKFQMAQFALSVYTQLIGVNVDAVKEAAHAAQSVLKSFLRYKAKDKAPVKEGNEANSILESAMKFI